MVLVVWFLPNYLSFARTPRSESDSLLVGVVLCLHSLFLSLSLCVCVWRFEFLRFVSYVTWVRNGCVGGAFSSHEHSPGTYRGGFVAALQKFVPACASGCFSTPPRVFAHSNEYFVMSLSTRCQLGYVGACGCGVCVGIGC